MKIIFSLFVLFVFSFYSQFSSQNYSIQNISSELLQNSNAVVRWENRTIEIKSINSMIVNYDLVVTVLNESASDFGLVGTYYEPDEKLNCEVKIYNAMGTEIQKFKKKDFEDQSVNKGYNISDNRLLFLEYKALKYPYTIHYHYEKTTPTTAFISDFSPTFNENVSIEKSEYRIVNNSDIKLQYKVYNPYSYTIESEENNPNDLVFRIKEFPSINSEPFAPRLADIVPHIEFSLEKFNLKGSTGNSDSWQSFGKWMYDDFLVPTSSISESMKKEFQNVTSEAKNNKEKVALLYEYLQKNMRYISVQLGVGGWKPMYPQDVEKYKYGDCKALSNYMKNALESIGIPANYTVLYSNEDFLSFDDDFPIMQGNHAIINVPLEGERIWLECTSQDLAFNYIGVNNDNRKVLSVNDIGGEILQTPKFDALKNQEIIDAQFDLKIDGSASFSAELAYTGSQYGTQIYIRYKDPKRLEEHYREKFEELPNLQLKENEYFNDKEKAIYTEKLKGEVKQFSKKVGNDLLFHAIPYGKLDFTLETLESRKFPFLIRRGIKDDFTYEIKIPSSYNLSKLPENITIKNEKFGEYQLNFSQNNNEIKVHRILYMKDGKFEKELYNEYVDFINAAYNADQTKLYIEKL